MGFLDGLSGLGGVVGGILDIHKATGGDDNGYMHPQVQAQIQSGVALEHAKADFNQKMELAKQHGIHPLSVLGVPTANFSPAISFGSDSPGPGFGDSFGRITDGLERLTAETKSPVEEAQASNSLQTRLLEAQVRRAESQADLAQIDVVNARNSLMNQPGNPPQARTGSNDVNSVRTMVAKQSGIPLSLIGGGDAPVTIKQEVLPPHPTQTGTAAASDQAWVNIIDHTGKPTKILNQQAVQAEFEQGATITALSKVFGLERAIEIAAVLENSGVIGGIGAALGVGAHSLYRYFGDQRAEALKRRMNPRVIIRSDKNKPYKPSWRKGGDQ